VVTVHGSIDTWPDFPSGGELIQEWAVRTLDKGTLSQDRFELGDRLENLGARISYSSAGSRIRFSARMLRPDVNTVLGLLFEQIREPAFDASELAKSHDRIVAALQRSKSEGGYRADVALAKAVFPGDHPNAMIDPDAELSQLSGIQQDEVAAFHRDVILRRPIRLAIVGDVDQTTCRTAVEAATERWGAVAEAKPDIAVQPLSKPGEARVEIADRDNLEVRWGHSMALLRGDDAFLPSYMANFIIGGNFSARLMNIVRDELGLTYGVGAGLSGVHRHYSGMWQVHITLSRENLAEGIEATTKVVRDYVASGASATELSTTIDTIAGSYQVRLATTGGLASAILQQMEEGRSMSYLDEYPSRVRGTTLEAVNGALGDYFEPNRLFMAVAGTMPGEQAVSRLP